MRKPAESLRAKYYDKRTAPSIENSPLNAAPVLSVVLVMERCLHAFMPLQRARLRGASSSIRDHFESLR